MILVICASYRRVLDIIFGCYSQTVAAAAAAAAAAAKVLYVDSPEVKNRIASEAEIQ